MKKIYFKDAEKAKSLKKLMLLLFSSVNGDNKYSVQTFLDKELKILDCKEQSRRSFEDLLCIANTYFKNVTELRLMKCLYDINIHFYYCSDINKIVFHFVITAPCLKNGSFLLYNYKKLKKGTYTIDQLENLLNKVKSKNG